MTSPRPLVITKQGAESFVWRDGDPALDRFRRSSRTLETGGSEVAPGIVFHYTPEGEVTAIDIDSKASEMVDLSSLEVEGLRVSVATASRQESKAV